MKRITSWGPNDEKFWRETGEKVAKRNLWISAFALHLAFCVWQVWSVISVDLPNIGFDYSTTQIFTLTGLPALSSALLRMLYSVVIIYFGGRTWTVISTVVLLIPLIGISIAIQNPDTPFVVMALLSILCGLGGANFSSSMANIGPMFPTEKQGTALGINGGLGNLGVSTVQLLTPLVITFPLFSALAGEPQILSANGEDSRVWLQNGAFLWVIPIVIMTIVAFFGMNDLPRPKTSIAEQFQIFRRKHMYIVTILYIMSFGSFIGFSAAFPLLINNQFPTVNAFQFAFIGPLLSSVFRTVGGYLSDQFGGAVVSFISVVAMITGTGGVMYFMSEQTSHFSGFFIMFLVLFLSGGIVNGSIFRMIPFIFREKETSAAIGFSSAVGSLGGFFIPNMFGLSIDLVGTAQLALLVFLFYYILCSVLLWYYYMRPSAEIKC
ncbi:MFS transporter [Texcoconibacillus texcoconensis]|uniref:NNP family nitrate/nitrite transporter-like MFS transporter n=1 Tax=Texcoconibacillus texcoconensis TaxID=1095777 RepID=A0A840QIT1_9BACI|nr:MFS transporter [Texcoconibacillus texcoconensis]MBB5171868.1 NNP family nitrate/nitrite transporter-like MFS transporter [Texcoconibacillus texcoconensis]